MPPATGSEAVGALADAAGWEAAGVDADGDDDAAGLVQAPAIRAITASRLNGRNRVR